MRNGLQIFGTIALAAAAAPSLAQQATDTCADAPFIALNGTYVSTSVGADPDFFGLCGHADAFDVWFRVTAANDGEHTFLLSSNYMDTTLALFSACGGGFEGLLACNDDGPNGTDSELLYGLSAGQTVYIRVAGNALDDGPFTIRVNGPSVQPTGACCSGSVCSVALESACVGVAMRWAGASSLCNAAGDLATPCCKADFNQDRIVSVQDIFDFLDAYFSSAPTADINGFDGVGVGDIFVFLTGYFGGCP